MRQHADNIAGHNPRAHSCSARRWSMRDKMDASRDVSLRCHYRLGQDIHSYDWFWLRTLLINAAGIAASDNQMARS
jgi:hypothetical protein